MSPDTSKIARSQNAADLSLMAFGVKRSQVFSDDDNDLIALNYAA